MKKTITFTTKPKKNMTLTKKKPLMIPKGRSPKRFA